METRCRLGEKEEGDGSEKDRTYHSQINLDNGGKAILPRCPQKIIRSQGVAYVYISNHACNASQDTQA